MVLDRKANFLPSKQMVCSEIPIVPSEKFVFGVESQFSLGEKGVLVSKTHFLQVKTEKPWLWIVLYSLPKECFFVFFRLFMAKNWFSGPIIFFQGKVWYRTKTIFSLRNPKNKFGEFGHIDVFLSFFLISLA